MELSGYLSELLAQGRTVFSSEEAERGIGVNHGAFLDAAERLQRQKKLATPRRGFYIVVPPQFASWGAPPPSWYVDALMQHESSPYYVGLLKAAELHGATHQAVSEFQVITEKRLRSVQVGRSPLSFYYRKDLTAVLAATSEHKTETGSMRVSSVELTALDLLRYPQATAGLDNIVTVLSDLADKIAPEKLATLCDAFQKSQIQRLGHLLDRLGYSSLTQPLWNELLKNSLPAWVELDPQEGSDPQLASPPIERDSRWNVVVRRTPEVDE